MGRALSVASFWEDSAPPAARRPALPGDATYDVAIVGAGLTGLWTAHSLIRADPTLRIVVLEAERVGFGASGRNGGWCSALFPASLARMASLPGSSRASALGLAAAMRSAVDEVGRVCADEAIEAHYVKGGTVVAARSRAQVSRAQAEVTDAAAWGLADHLVWLGREEAGSRIGATGLRGATYTPDCARIHPLRLVRGLADVVEATGVRIHEGTRVLDLAPGRVRTSAGTVTADVVVRATEGYTSGLPGLARTSIPVYSLVTVTEPLTDAQWAAVGLAGSETFSDHRHLIVYGQRTADGRLVFGGRGAPYHLGSRVRPSYDSVPQVFGALRETLVEMFPALRPVRMTHGWGGPLGISRDWTASVGLDRSTGLAWAGGYVGDGVTTTNLAGRTLCDLILGETTDLTALPWVNHRSPQWEPEPWRWLGVNSGLRAMTLADHEERLTRRPSLIARVMGPLIGGH